MRLMGMRVKLIGERLKRAREHLKLSLEEWAEKLELDPKLYELIEEGRVVPDIHTISLVSHLTGRSADWILTGVSHSERR